MAPLIVICLGIILVITVAAVWSGWAAPPGAATLIRIRAGEVIVKRGRVNTHVREHIAHIARDHNVSRGFIAVSSAKRMTFSRSIPNVARQPLRNVLINK
jgi:hypothetical protein